MIRRFLFCKRLIPLYLRIDPQPDREKMKLLWDIAVKTESVPRVAKANLGVLRNLGTIKVSRRQIQVPAPVFNIRRDRSILYLTKSRWINPKCSFYLLRILYAHVCHRLKTRKTYLSLIAHAFNNTQWRANLLIFVYDYIIEWEK